MSTEHRIPNLTGHTMMLAWMMLAISCSQNEPESPNTTPQEALNPPENNQIVTEQPADADEGPEPPVEEPAEEPAEEPVEEVVEEAAEEPVEEAAEEPVEEVVEEAAEEPVEEVVEEAAEEPVEEVVEEAAEEPVEEVVEEAAEESVEEELRSFDVNGGNSRLYVQVFKDPSTVAAGASHDHVMVARGWSGTVRWHSQDAGQCLIDVVVPVSELRVDPPAMRRAVGYDSELSESQRESVRKNMLARDQLNASAHPNITFRSESCSGTVGSVVVSGALTIRGVTQSIRVPLEVSLEDGYSASGVFTVRHTDFGFEPYSAMMGALRNQDQMRFTVKLSSE